MDKANASHTQSGRGNNRAPITALELDGDIVQCDDCCRAHSVLVESNAEGSARRKSRGKGHSVRTYRLNWMRTTTWLLVATATVLFADSNKDYEILIGRHGDLLSELEQVLTKQVL